MMQNCCCNSVCDVLQAFKVLSHDFVNKHPYMKQQATLQLLNHTTVLGHNRKLAVDAFKVLKGYNDDVLLAGGPLQCVLYNHTNTLCPFKSVAFC